MARIPENFRRVLEDRIDNILKRHFSSITPLALWFFRKVFDAELISVQGAEIHKHNDYRRVSGDQLAYGETDIEVIAVLESPALGKLRVGLLIENKVDANQMEKQGLRYSARGSYRKRAGDWDDFRCILLAPDSYLEAQYVGADFRRDGWDYAVRYEDVVEVLVSVSSDDMDAAILLEATTTANSWNKPIPAAVQFWKDYEEFGRSFHPDVPVFVKTEKGSRAGGVWPSFYDNVLRTNSKEPSRKRIQIVHVDTAGHVALFVKRVGYGDFLSVAIGLTESGIHIGPPGTSWQSFRLTVPNVDPRLALATQQNQVDQIFHAVRRMFDFYLRNEQALLAIPVTNKNSA